MKAKLFIISTFFISLMSACSSSGDEDNTDKSSEYTYQEYVDKVDKAVNNLEPDAKAFRDSVYQVMQANPVYDDLVKKENVSVEYLPVLTGISEVTRSANPKGFTLSDGIAQKLETNENYINFVLNNAMLLFRGGLPPEITEAFERYRKLYSYSGVTGDTHVTVDDKSTTTIDHPYNLAPAFAVFDPKNPKVLDALQEAVNKGAAKWRDGDPDNTYFYPYLTWKSAYIAYLKEHHPESEFIPDWEYELTATELYNAYNANEISADKKYKGKKLAVTGTITAINRDVMGDVFVLLQTNNMINSVACYPENEDIVADLQKDQQVSFVGVCEGMDALKVSVQLKGADLIN